MEQIAVLYHKETQQEDGAQLPQPQQPAMSTGICSTELGKESKSGSAASN